MSNAILLVEDNAIDEKLTLRMFKASNVQNEVVVMRDGVGALDYLLGKSEGPSVSELPALMLLDLKLPRMSGLDVLREVRSHERSKYLPVLVLTASNEEEDSIRSYALGANAYVRKPVEFPQFIEAARSLGLFWLLLGEREPEPFEP